MKWSVFMIMTGMGNPFLTTVNKRITLDTRGACISCVLFPNLWSWPSPSRNITTPPSDTTTMIPPSDRYIPGRYIATPEQLWGRISQPVNPSSAIALNFKEEICSSMSVLASCVSTNENSSFYSTHLQVWFTVVSDNRSAAISMWFKSNTHIQPTLLLCPRFQVFFRVEVQNCISMVVIIEIHNVQGYLWLANIDALVGGTILDGGSHVSYLNCCFASITVLTWPFGILVHIRIPMWSQLWSDKDRQEALVGPQIIQFSRI